MQHAGARGEPVAGLSGVLRLTAGLAILALAALAALVVLDAIPSDRVAPYGQRILLLTLIVGLAAGGIGGLVRWGRRSCALLLLGSQENLSFATRMAPFRITMPALVAITGQSVLSTP